MFKGSFILFMKCSIYCESGVIRRWFEFIAGIQSAQMFLSASSFSSSPPFVIIFIEKLNNSGIQCFGWKQM